MSPPFSSSLQRLCHPEVNPASRSQPGPGRPTRTLALVLFGGLIGFVFLASSASSAPTPDEVARKLNVPVGLIQQLTRQRAFTLETLDHLPPDRVPRVLGRLNYPDLPRNRASFNLLRQRNEQGIIPHGSRSRAIFGLNALRQNLPAAKVAGVPVGPTVAPRNLNPLVGGISPQGWVGLGPGNVGGRTRSLVIHPTTPATLWAGSVAGGVWRSDDGGQNFHPVDDFMVNLAVSCLAMDPTNPQVIYAGTGEGFFNLDGLRGAGIFHTTDGTTWSQIQATNTPAFQWVNRLAVSPDGQVLLAATHSDSGAGGIYLSSDAARASWTQVLNQPVGDVKFHPTDKSKAVAGGLLNGQAYHSEDGGRTWKPAVQPGSGGGRIEVAYARKDPTVVYVSANVNGGELWRSTDGGKTYSRRNSGTNYLGNQGWYDNVVWAGDPTNANLVLVGGIDLWKSVDGGTTLKDISTWWAPSGTSAHADQHAIVAHPQFDGVQNRTMFFGNDGGVFTTKDLYTLGNNPQPPRVNGWAALNKTYVVTQFYGAAGNPNTGVIVAGAQDNGTVRFTPSGGAYQWSTMFGGDGGFCCADLRNPDTFYGEYVNLNITRSLDGGNSAGYISGQYFDGSWKWKNVPYQIPDAKATADNPANPHTNFIAPFVLDPNESNRILAGGLSLWRTNDARTANTNTTGPKWASIKASTGSLISAIAIAPGKSDVIWVGHNNGDVYYTSNGTAANPTWVKCDQNGPTKLPRRYCTRIVIDSNQPARVFVTFGGYSSDNVWLTTNTGATWTDIGTSLPAAPIYSLAIHPLRPNNLYLGTGVGLFASEDGGKGWAPTNEGPTNCAVDDMFWMKTSLYVATHGRGLFKIDLP